MKTGESGQGASARRALYVLMALAGIWVAALTVFSNHHDWDAFYALAEVDYRSWWVDHELPLWSYQMCAGISRIADPQAFGLSPLFILVLVFGSFWGTKLLVLLSLGLGVFFTARILELAHCHGSDQPPERRLYLALALLFVFGNYFMWHLLVGHVTFSVMLLGMGIAYFTLKGYLDGLSRGELACGALLAWQHYSSAFYHSSIYFLAPFFIAFAIFVVADSVRDRRRSGPGSVRRATLKLRHALGFNVAGVVLGSYKIWAAWSYSRGIGRRHDVLHETLEPMQVGFHLLIPTWHRRFLIDFDPGNFWDVHEYSAFSLIVPLALGVAAWALARRRDWTGLSGISSVGLFAGTYLFVAGCFSLGDFSPFSPYGLINRLLLGSEARIIGRFHIGIILALAMILMVLLRAPHRRRWIGDATCSVLLAGLLVNLSGFLTLANGRQLEKILAYPAEPSARMQSWRWAKVFLPEAGEMGKELAPDSTVNMYRYILVGEGIRNCYNALPRSRGRMPRARFVPLINPSATSPDPQCKKESRYTQNRIVLSDACRGLVCVNAAHINPAQGELHFEVVRKVAGFCTRLPAAGGRESPEETRGEDRPPSKAGESTGGVF